MAARNTATGGTGPASTDAGSTDYRPGLTALALAGAAFILMFAFLLLSTSPGYESKEFAIALAGGIIFDATVIRALLVPALMRLLGNANWWMPSWTRTILLLRRPASRPGLRPELTGRKA